MTKIDIYMRGQNLGTHSFLRGTYGLLNNMPDDELVRFASACSAFSISRFPLPLNPPTLDEMNSLLENANNK